MLESSQLGIKKINEKYKNIYAEIVYNPELWKWSD